MGRQQRRKGHDFERAIARELRTRWPDAIVRRASQAERADNPDVFVEGGPPVLAKLWLELQHANTPTPIAKLEQAETDALAWCAARPLSTRLPVAIWRRTGERTIWVTTRLGVLDALRTRGDVGPGDAAVTLDLGAFLELLS